MSNGGGINRRDFLKGAAATAALLMSVEELFAADAPAATPAAASAGPAVKIGVIGLGVWGKDVVATLSKLPSAQITAICDGYEPFLNRAAKVAEKAAKFSDYRKLLESPDVEAVVIATPSHLHKEIALAAIQAGKHVYCEAPLASNIDDAKAIALAGQGSKKVFQVGLQGRSNPLFEHVSKFVKTGALGNIVQAQAQWNKKNSWKRPAPSSEREKECNWRLSKSTSPGLLGEVGVHQLDLVNWYVGALPTAVSGFGAILNWKDGRDVPDTVHCILEYANDVQVIFTSTLANSFSGSYTLFQGSDSSLMMRENRGWMIKEADSALLGWEVYARKEPCYDETGICMIADATKILKEGKEPGKDSTVEPTREPLYVAFENFTKSVREGAKCPCGALEGYHATVVALKANEAILTNAKVSYQKEWFDLK